MLSQSCHGSSAGSSLTRRIFTSPGSSSDGGASPTRHGNISATGEHSADDDFANEEGEQSIIDGIVASIAEPSTADGVDHGGQSGEMLLGNLFSQINTPAAGTGPGQAQLGGAMPAPITKKSRGTSQQDGEHHSKKLRCQEPSLPPAASYTHRPPSQPRCQEPSLPPAASYTHRPPSQPPVPVRQRS